MKKYEFPNPVTHSYGDVQPGSSEWVEKVSQSIQTECESMRSGNIRVIRQEMEMIDKVAGWWLFPKDDPVYTPAAWVKVVLGVSSKDFLSAVKVFSDVEYRILSKLLGKRKVQCRQEYSKLHEGKQTQQQIADELGVSDRTIRGDLKAEKNTVMTPKISAPRKREVLQISQYTKPETAARKIRDKFGDEFAEKLSILLKINLDNP